MDNVAGQPSDTEWKPAREKEHSADDREQRGGNEESTAEFTL